MGGGDEMAVSSLSLVAELVVEAFPMDPEYLRSW
jgi:hypothetical protein